MWLFCHLDLLPSFHQASQILNLPGEIKTILISETKLIIPLKKKCIPKWWAGRTEMKTTGTMRRKSFQVLNILAYFSHDPVTENQDSILKAGHLGKHRNL